MKKKIRSPHGTWQLDAVNKKGVEPIFRNLSQNIPVELNKNWELSYAMWNIFLDLGS